LRTSFAARSLRSKAIHAPFDAQLRRKTFMSEPSRKLGSAQVVPMSGHAPLGLREWLQFRAGELSGHLGRWCREEDERRRLFNWLPVPMGLGVIAYFMADREPGLIAPVVGMAACATIAAVARASQPTRFIAIAFCFMFLGFASAVVRTASVSAPILDRAMIVKLTGHVESVEKRANGARLVIQPTSLGDVPAEKIPSRVRVTQRGGGIVAGDHISGTVRLLPPPEPARPGGYDFARDAFFRGVGAVGSFSGAPQLAAAPSPPDIWLSINAAIDRGRNHLTDRIVATVGGQAGAVAAALVTGKRGLISEGSNEALRAAGIYHIVSISGLHMVLVAGAIFWLMRAILALSGWAVLRWPIKKLAALTAMIGATAYCVFSGSDVATERSLIMTLVMLGAILVDRPALSMRNLAIAAIIVLLREPETLLGPSFQMSFGAVAALIAWAERRNRAESTPPPVSLVGRMARMVKFAVIADVITTLLATAATAPFGLYHFNTANPYGLLGNALALPFISLIVMPAAVAGALLYPFGLDAIAWWIMGEGTKPLLAFSGAIANWPQSTLKLPAYSPAALVILAFALLWFTLWTTPLRWFGVMPLVLGFSLASTPIKPDGYIDRDGRGLAIRAGDSRLMVLGKPANFALAQWLAADGDQRKPADPSLVQGTRCDPAGCVLELGGKGIISHVTTRRAVSEDCDLADIVVTPIAWRAPCKALLIDRQALDQLGSATITWRDGRWHVSGARRLSTASQSGQGHILAQEINPTQTAPSDTALNNTTPSVVVRPWLRQPREIPRVITPVSPAETQTAPAADETDDLRTQ
jgi:competence protein ComEC